MCARRVPRAAAGLTAFEYVHETHTGCAPRAPAVAALWRELAEHRRTLTAFK